MGRMSSVQPLQVTGLLPLPRPLMIGEVLDAAFRLFRAGLLRCLPYSGLAVLVLELPTLYSTFLFSGKRDVKLEFAAYLGALLLTTALLGVITLRLFAVSRGMRPRFRTEIATALRRLPTALIATIGALGFPLLFFVLFPLVSNVLPSMAFLVIALPLFWPAALFVVALPAFWCDGRGPFSSIVHSLRLSWRRSWRMVGAIFATACVIAVFYLVSAMLVAMLTPLLGRADLFLIATVSSMLSLVVGAFGVPFVLAVLIVAYEDLKLRDLQRRGASR
jgi:hypothetical protein